MPLNRELLEALDESVKPVNEARLLPPELYTSAEFFEFEQESIFLHEWLCVGRHDQVPNPGDYFTITLMGEPLIVVRADDGRIRVMTAVCRHRGMVIAEDSGTCARFTCPYHHWSYATDGTLVGTPAMDRAVDFDRADHPLPQLRVEQWQGFIFANFDPDAAPLGPRLRKIDAILENYHLDSTTTLAGKRLENLPWKDLTEADRRRGSFVLLPPTLALAIVPDEVAYFIVDPLSAGSITIQIGYCFEEAALKDPMFEYLFAQAEAGVDNFNVQDVYADTMTQIGLNSRFAPRGRYSWQEETLAQFNRWLVQRYRAHWPVEGTA